MLRKYHKQIGIFPQYWFYPHQVILHKNSIDDLAIVLKRKVSGKNDKVSIRNCEDMIEKAEMPNLAYEKSRTMFSQFANIHNVAPSYKKL